MTLLTRDFLAGARRTEHENRGGGGGGWRALAGGLWANNYFSVEVAGGHTGIRSRDYSFTIMCSYYWHTCGRRKFGLGGRNYYYLITCSAFMEISSHTLKFKVYIYSKLLSKTKKG